MEHAIKKFLEFNGKKIYFKSVDGLWWIAVKPVCEALGVKYMRQFEKLKSEEYCDEIKTGLKQIGIETINQLYPSGGIVEVENDIEITSMQMVIASDGKMREMLCIQEVFQKIKEESRIANKLDQDYITNQLELWSV